MQKKTRLASAISYSKKPQRGYLNSMQFGPGQLKNLSKQKSGLNSGRSQSKQIGRNINVNNTQQDTQIRNTIVSPKSQEKRPNIPIRPTF
jgi:hypothetical protein